MKRIFLLILIGLFFETNNDLLGATGKHNGDCGRAQKKIKLEKELWPVVTKKSENLYVSQVADKFYLAMERIDKSNQDDWLRYARYQDSAASHKPIKYFLPHGVGAGRFKAVLENYEQLVVNWDNDLWVAYASCAPITDKAFCTFEDIDMYVSIITSENALFTSHMGISRSWEAARDLAEKDPKRKKYSYQSMYLHAFAAKVIKLIDHRKVYMLTPPTPIMNSIFLKKMPTESFFVGDNFYKKDLESEEKDSIIIVDNLVISETLQEREERLKKEAAMRIRLKTNPPRLIRTKGLHPTFTIQKPNGENLITFDYSTSTYQWMYTDPYKAKGLSCPYMLILLENLAQVMER